MTDSTKPKGMTYKGAGVDIAAGNELVRRIKPLAKSTARSGVLAGIGGFGGLFQMAGYTDPVLVAGTDGVGTKLKLAIELDRHDSIGIDLVAMCVNDVLVQGAEPLFFLDYLATGKLDVDRAEAIIRGIAKGCRQAGCALLGGETAEMPGMYHGEDYDLAGFCVGVVERNAMIDGSQIRMGDVLVGIASSGPHSNGYSLIRTLITQSGADLAASFEGKTLGKILLAPTRIYVNSVHSLMRTRLIHGLVHITGGGLTENLPRIMPETLRARIDTRSWRWPAIFNWLQTTGGIDTREMYRTFNCGIGMVVAVAPNDAKRCVEILGEQGEQAWQLGEIISATPDTAQVQFV
ncbi:MAG: phosphoribosylformylglycinamidine cyclo-ligase [Gammaproteobacteria bacterium]|nr:MAG: phosphoribosylformylglycinamidine cyclo-ligase [Gammaproteobacteria bacterium]